MDSKTKVTVWHGPTTTLYGHCINPKELIRTTAAFGVDLIGERDVRGATVINVAPGSIAAKAGLMHRDVVVEYAGRSIDTAVALQTAVVESVPGSVVSMKVHREDQDLSLSAHF